MDTRPSRPMDRTIDSSTNPQLRIRGIHDGINLLPSDITLRQFDTAGCEVNLHEESG